GRTVVHLALGAIDKCVNRHVRREETTETQPIIELTAVGIALVVIEVGAHGRGDVPAPVIGRGCRAAGRVGGGGSGVLRMNGTYAAQGQRNQKVQALTFHQVSPQLLGFRVRSTPNRKSRVRTFSSLSELLQPLLGVPAASGG